MANERRNDWYVFPIKTRAKAPPLLKDWEHAASNDPARIAKWEARFPGCNWGIACGPSGLTVVDIDPKNGGDETFERLQENPDTLCPPTFTVRTPSGGRHLYYAGATSKSSSGKIGAGIDTRSTGGYVLLAGASIEAGEYTIESDTEPASTPEWIGARLGEAALKDRNRDIPICELDTGLNTGAAITYLEGPARIDVPAYTVACNVRDFGISEEKCLDLMWKFYAGRCEEPWDYDVLAQKVANAYNYAQNRLGCDAPEAILSHFEPIPKTEPVKTAHRIELFNASDIIIDSIPPRQWVLGRRYLRGQLTLTIAPGGQGKSILTMAEAASVASGRELTWQPIHNQGRVWIVNMEDSLTEMQRRMAALIIEHELPREELSNIILTSGLRNPFNLMRQERDRLLINRKLVDRIKEIITQEKIALLSIDPFVRCHQCSENDNTAIDKVAQILIEIADDTNCAVGLVHHARKGANIAGDAENSRGASSLIAAARIAHTLTSMTSAEGIALGKTAGEEDWYVRLDDAKANLSPPGASTQWFRRVSVNLGNGDSVGIVRPEIVSLEEALNREDEELVAAVFKLWSEPITIYAMAGELVKNSLGAPGMQQRLVRDRIGKLFKGVLRTRNGKCLTAELGQGKKTRAYYLVEGDSTAIEG